jgi:hypothetical protein
MTLGPGQLCGELGVIGLGGWGSAQGINNLTLDGITITDWSTCSGGHSQAIWAGQGVNGLTIKNSTFLSNNEFTTSFIFWGTVPVAAPGVKHIVIENNFFGDFSPGYYVAYGNQAYVPGNCVDVIFRYNTSLKTLWTGYGDDCNDSNVSFIGNLAPKAYDCESVVSIDNVWDGPPCSSSDLQRSESSWNLVGDGFHLGSGSIAIGNGSRTYCPATDHDGEQRPRPSGTTCDAGADEVG